MKISQIIPLLIFVALVSYLIGNHIHDRELARDKAINRARINSHADKWHKELKRITSPGGRVDAILAEIEIDSLNPNGYAVYLVPAGKRLDLQSRFPNRKVFYANRVTGLELAWKDREFLDISYAHGDIFEFQNNWILDKECRVEIRIVPQSASYSLSK